MKERVEEKGGIEDAGDEKEEKRSRTKDQDESEGARAKGHQEEENEERKGEDSWLIPLLFNQLQKVDMRQV